ncbi:MAG TPA: hypothetical protein VME19_06280 [Streptosporangiaceae bacterium]|nr:hypothetical protein [Streptosporangiaceae bacterium]
MADMLPSPRRSRDARQVLPGRGFAAGAAILGSQAGLRAAGVPWWTICLLGTLGLAAMCLQIVFPQDSPDKVAWWSERRRYQRRQGCRSRRRCRCQHQTTFLRVGARPDHGARTTVSSAKSIFLNKR